MFLVAPLLPRTRTPPTRRTIVAITRRLSDAKKYHYPEGTTKESARLFRKREKANARKQRKRDLETPIGFGMETKLVGPPEIDPRAKLDHLRMAQEYAAEHKRAFPNPDMPDLIDEALFMLSDGPADDLLHLLRARYVEREQLEQAGEPVLLDEDVQPVYTALIKEILHCDRLYYADDPKPRVADRIYDELVMHLLEIERRFPQIISPDSPSQNVGHGAAARASKLGMDNEVHDAPMDSFSSFAETVSVYSRRFPQYRHKAPMLSLDNAYNHEDLVAFMRRANVADSNVAAELKVDGVALSLEYVNGRLAVAATRGTGRIGDNVTDNVRSSLVGRGVVDDLTFNDVPQWMLVRGEVYISPDDFREVNSTLERPLSNARNAAAGALKHKSVDECRRRRLRFIAYECLTTPQAATADNAEQTATERNATADAINTFATQQETLHRLAGWGFGAMPRHAQCETLEDAEQFAVRVEEDRDQLDMEVDGIVFKMEMSRSREAVGHTARAPRGAIAYKFAAQARVTRVMDVVMQVSRKGIITPVAILSPVRVGGATLSRATLHNFEEVKRLGVAVGDEIRIERGGDVIPKVIGVERQADSESRRAIEPPTSCPCCGGEVEAKEEGKNGTVLYKCVNNMTCTAQTLGRVLHFAGREAMDIKMLGRKTAERLVNNGLLVVVADVFRLTLDDILSLEGYAEKSAKQLLVSIEEAATSRSLERLLIGLGLPGVGRTGARSLALKIESLDKLLHIGQDENGVETLLGIPNIAQKTAAALHAHLQRDQVAGELRAMLQLVKQNSIVDEEDAEGKADTVEFGSVSEKSFAFTGKFTTLSRPEMMKWVKKCGGRVMSDVSKKTDFVITGLDPGNKLFKAQRLHRCIVHEEEFITFFGVPPDVEKTITLAVAQTKVDDASNNGGDDETRKG